MPRVKIVQVFNHSMSYEDEPYQASVSDLQSLTEWEEISETDMIHLKSWVRDRSSHGPYGNTWTNRSAADFAILIEPDPPVSAITSVKEVVDKYKADLDKAAKTRELAAARYEATKLDRKRKQLEKLKRELGEGTNS